MFHMNDPYQFSLLQAVRCSINFQFFDSSAYNPGCNVDSIYQPIFIIWK
jgi:hypothetical protein